MRRATITIDGDLDEALRNYLSGMQAAPTLTALVQAALREFLARRGALAPSHPLHITPARKGSGKSDVSEKHDYYFTTDE
jgi:hypothetical protein